MINNPRCSYCKQPVVRSNHPKIGATFSCFDCKTKRQRKTALDYIKKKRSLIKQ